MELELHKLIASKHLQRGISIDELAQRCSCSPIELSGYEKGLLILNETSICKLIKVLEISLSELSQACGEAIATRLLNQCQ